MDPTPVYNDELSTKKLLLTNAIPNYKLPKHLESCRTYDCVPCGDRFIIESSLDYHINRKTMKITYFCRHCNEEKIFFNRCTTLSHIRSHGIEIAAINFSDVKIEVLPLEYFDHGNQINSQIEAMPLPSSKNQDDTEVQNEKQIVHCFDCNTNIFCSGVIYRDRAKHYTQHTNKLYSCPICSLTLSTRCALEAHLRIHLKEPPYYCPDCGVFLTKLAIEYPYAHDCESFKMMRATAKLKCAVNNCNMIYHPSESNTHLSSHHLKQVYKCSICNVACFKFVNMQKHLKTHVSELNPIDAKNLIHIDFFQCAMCPGRLVIPNQIERHLKNHENYETNCVYPCWTCGSILKFAKNLLAHYKFNHQDIYTEKVFGKVLQESNEGKAPESNTEKVSQEFDAGKVSQETNAGIVSQESNSGNVSQETNTGEVSQESNAGNISQETITGEVSQESNAEKVSQESNAGNVFLEFSVAKVSQATIAGEVSQEPDARKNLQEADVGKVSQESKIEKVSQESNVANPKKINIAKAKPFHRASEICYKCFRNFASKHSTNINSVIICKCFKPKIVCGLCHVAITQDWHIIKKHYAIYHKEHKCLEAKIVAKKINMIQFKNSKKFKKVNDNENVSSSINNDITPESSTDNNLMSLDDNTYTNPNLVSVVNTAGSSTNNDILMSLDDKNTTMPNLVNQVNIPESGTNHDKFMSLDDHISTDPNLVHLVGSMESSINNDNLMSLDDNNSTNPNLVSVGNNAGSTTNNNNLISLDYNNSTNLSRASVVKYAPGLRSVVDKPVASSGPVMGCSQDNNKYICVKCGHGYKDKHHLENHIVEHRDPFMAYQCMECGDSFIAKTSFTTHLKVRHGLHDVNNYIEQKKCYNKDSLNLQKHSLEENEPVKENQCNICRKQFCNSMEFEKHFRVHGMAFLMKYSNKQKNSENL